MRGTRFVSYLLSSTIGLLPVAVGAQTVPSDGQPSPAVQSSTSDAAAASAPSGSVLAQSSTVPSPQDSPAVETSAAPADIGDIVVTAQKREQRLNDVGLTVTALGGATLRERGVATLADIAQAVPGLSYTNSANNTPVYTLRGVGFYETSLAAYPTVSVYLDEVSLPFPALTKHSAFDLERLEVLKGPQGTLFGQNATGGAINYIAAKPTSDLRSGGTVSYGRFDEVLADAYISGPITANLKGRLAGRIEHAANWQQSLSRPGDGLGKVRNYMARLLLDWQPFDSARFALNLNGWKDESDTQAPQFVGIQPQFEGFLDPSVTPANYAPARARAADWTPGVPFANNRFLQASLRADVDVAGDVTLTSLTAYTDYRQRQGDDGDGLPISTTDLSQDNGSIKTFSQELRLANGSGSALRWVIGGNYEHSTVDQSIRLQYRETSARYALAFAGFDIIGGNFSSDQNIENYAFFGNAEYQLNDRLTLKAGARYTNSRRDASICQFDPNGLGGELSDFLYQVVLGGAFGPYPRGACFSINALGGPQGGVPNGAPGRFLDRLHEDNVSWRAGLDYKVQPGSLLYANVAKGYKAGSYPTLSASTFRQYLPARQESVLAVEGGFKLSALDRTLQLNGAAFYYDYNDKQLRSKVVDPVFGILDVLQNIPKSSIRGFELEATARPTPGLTVSAAFTFLDASIDRFSGINAVGVAAAFDGTRVPYTPRYQAGVNADYDRPLNDRLAAFVGTSLNFRSDTIAIIGGDISSPRVTGTTNPPFGIKDYAVLDMRAGIRTSDDRYRFTVWGKNVLSEYYWDNVVSAYDTVARYAQKPATYGVSLSVAFR